MIYRPTGRFIVSWRRVGRARRRVKYRIESVLMSLLLQRKGPAAPLPRLEGKEVLVGPNPDAAKVKGVMFGGRKQFINEVAGEGGFAAIVSKLSPRTASYTKTPLASSW